MTTAMTIVILQTIRIRGGRNGNRPKLTRRESRRDHYPGNRDHQSAHEKEFQTGGHGIP